jgi:hypothetical protein
MKGTTALIGAAALGLVSASCGGSTSGGGSGCGAVTGCGGDLVGVWHVTSLCANLTLQALSSGDTMADYLAIEESSSIRQDGLT